MLVEVEHGELVSEARSELLRRVPEIAKELDVDLLGGLAGFASYDVQPVRGCFRRHEVGYFAVVAFRAA
jgi:hypothetical protein